MTNNNNHSGKSKGSRQKLIVAALTVIVLGCVSCAFLTYLIDPDIERETQQVNAETEEELPTPDEDDEPLYERSLQQEFMAMHLQYRERLDEADNPLEQQEIEQEIETDFMIIDDEDAMFVEQWQGSVGVIRPTETGNEFTVRIDSTWDIEPQDPLSAPSSYEMSFASTPISLDSDLYNVFRGVEEGECITFSGFLLAGPVSAWDVEIDQWERIMDNPMYRIQIQQATAQC